MAGISSTFARSALICAALALPEAGAAQDQASANLYGMPGLIDMPTAQSFEDADLATTYSWFADTHKTTLAFQIAPRLTGSFRYSVIGGWLAPGDPLFDEYDGNQYDRSFDLHFRLLNEGQYTPAVAIGLRDFMGTGLLSGEYIVASKQITPSIGVTGGVGWGRFSNSDEVHTGDTATGGVPNYKQWFRGPVGAFGGIEWKTPVKGLSVKAEYSSDRYFQETQDPARPAPIFDRRTPYNFGLEYAPRDNIRMGVYHMYGSEVAFRLTARLNPKRNPHGGTLEGAPLPVASRARPLSRDTGWLATPDIDTKGRDQLDQILTRQRLKVEALALEPNRGRLWFRNLGYEAAPQAFGRAARAMAYVMPDSVDVFQITLVEKGLPVSTMTLRRADLEALEHDPRGAEKMLAAVQVEGGVPMPAAARDPELYPDFKWSLGPFVGVSLFDPTNPVRADLGLRATGEFTLRPGLSLTGSVTKKIVGNRGEGLPEPSGLPRVRSEGGRYFEEGDPAIERLTLDYLFKPGQDLYGRVSVGYIEPMFGGVSTELLWKQASRNWGLGAEVNLVRQRDFDQLLGFRDYETVSGHASLYIDFRNGFEGRLDVGRYLAGDWGATIALDRTFDNGWKVGAYATLTDAPFDAFGEGSFDKGVQLTIPLGWALGKPSRRSYDFQLSSLARDGGARLNVGNRLYPLVQDGHLPELTDRWGRFWR